MIRQLADNVRAALSAWASRGVAPSAPKRERSWQKDPFKDHQVRVYSSPGATGRTSSGAPTPTRTLVTMRDNTVYIIYSDGSFRLKSVLPRRIANVSGRQRRIGRKLLRRYQREAAPYVAARLAGTTT